MLEVQAKTLYGLISCRNMSDMLFKHIVLSDPKRETAACYNFDLNIHMTKSENKKYRGIMIDYSHDGPLDVPNLITAEQKRQLLELFPSTNNKGIKAANVLLYMRHYLSSGYSRVFVSLVFNYGTFVNHQGFALLEKSRITYYEPYGTYSKHGHDYKHLLDKFFSIFAPNVSSFHSSPGVQTLLVQKNNKEWPIYKDTIRELVAKYKPREKFSREDLEFDHSSETVTLFGEVHKMTPEDAAETWKLMNVCSKLCVSISAIELYNILHADKLESISSRSIADKLFIILKKVKLYKYMMSRKLITENVLVCL